MSDHTLTLSSGRKLGYAEFGDPAGAPLFYFHGWPSSRLQGRMLHEYGQQHHLRVIAPDRPGIGLSDFQPDRRLLDWPPVLAELADSLGWEKFHMLGVSGGGPYALAAAHQLPERMLKVGICCGAVPLLLLGTEGLLWIYRMALVARRWAPSSLAPGLRLTEWLVRKEPSHWLLKFFFASLCEADRKAILQTNAYGVLTASCLEALHSSTDAVRVDGDLYSSDWGFDLGEIQTQVCFWHGAMDRNIPLSLAKRTAAMLPNTVTKWYPKDGHYSLVLQRIHEIVHELLGT